MDNNQPQTNQKNDQTVKPVITGNKVETAVKPTNANASLVNPADAAKTSAA